MNVSLLTDVEVEKAGEKLLELYLSALDQGRPVRAVEIREVLEEVRR